MASGTVQGSASVGCPFPNRSPAGSSAGGGARSSAALLPIKGCLPAGRKPASSGTPSREPGRTGATEAGHRCPTTFKKECDCYNATVHPDVGDIAWVYPLPCPLRTSSPLDPV